MIVNTADRDDVTVRLMSFGDNVRWNEMAILNDLFVCVSCVGDARKTQRGREREREACITLSISIQRRWDAVLECSAFYSVYKTMWGLRRNGTRSVAKWVIMVCSFVALHAIWARKMQFHMQIPKRPAQEVTPLFLRKLPKKIYERNRMVVSRKYTKETEKGNRRMGTKYDLLVWRVRDGVYICVRVRVDGTRPICHNTRTLRTQMSSLKIN